MLWVADQDGTCTYVSEEWRAFTGQTLGEALGNGWAAAVHPDDRTVVVMGFLEACRCQTEFILHYRLRRHDGLYVWALDAASPSFTPLTHDFLGFLGTVSCYDDPDIQLTAKVELGSFEPGQASLGASSPTKLDIIADYLIHAKILSEHHAPAVADAIELALHEAKIAQRAQIDAANASLKKQ
jgi:PAS domain S-box-containing protein